MPKCLWITRAFRHDCAPLLPASSKSTTRAANDRRGERCAIVARPHFLRHCVSPLRHSDLTHDDGVIDTIDPAEDPAWAEERCRFSHGIAPIYADDIGQEGYLEMTSRARVPTVERDRKEKIGDSVWPLTWDGKSARCGKLEFEILLAARFRRLLRTPRRLCMAPKNYASVLAAAGCCAGPTCRRVG
jgi:hypothetical protein